MIPAKENGWQWFLFNSGGVLRGVLQQYVYYNGCIFFFFAANIKLKPTVPGFPVYQGPIHCFRTVLQKEGIAGIYRGAGAMLLRDVPGYCFYFIPYTFFCDWITPDGCISPNPSSIWLAGGVAGKHLFFRQHWKTRMGRFPGQITGWLRGHRHPPGHQERTWGWTTFLPHDQVP